MGSSSASLGASPKANKGSVDSSGSPMVASIDRGFETVFELKWRRRVGVQQTV
jgi:hypothetical protein